VTERPAAGFACVSERWLGPLAPRPSVLLWVPHDAGNELLEALPELRAACAADDALLLRYLHLERDVGSSALARAIGSALAAQGLTVLVLEARLPRGLIDPARDPAHALRHVFRQDADPSLLRELRRMHEQTIAAFARHVDALDPQAALFLDLHTMHAHNPEGSPVSPTEALREQPDALAQYLHAYRLRAEAAPRPIDLVTRCEGTRVADGQLVEALARALAGAGHAVAEDEPYASAEHLVACHAMRARRGISVDVPKPLAADEAQRAHLATLMADAVLAALERDHKKG
jgi:N-formylglutamate amidohydrolase